MSTNVVKNGQPSLKQQLLEAKPMQVANIPAVKEKFINNVQLFQGMTPDKAASNFEQQKFHFLKIISENDKLQQCEPLSLYGCFMDAAVNGLSFDPQKKHVYIVPFGNKANLMVSGYGELYIRMRSGQIRYADNPIVVYEGDIFRHTVKDGKTTVEYEATLPRKTDNVVGCFMAITRADGSVDYKVLSVDELMRMKKFSKSGNSVAWQDQSLPGMIQAKTIKHAFRSYPKPSFNGKFTVLETDKIEEAEIAEEARVVDYGLDETKPATNAAPPVPPVPNLPKNGNDFFAGNSNAQGTTTVEDDTF